MDKQPTRNFTRLAIAIVLAALIVSSAVYLSDTSGARTSTLTSDSTSTLTTTTTIYENVRIVGNCTATSYFLPDTEEQLVTEITTTSGNFTSTYISYGSTIRATTTTLGSTSYSTYTYANNTTGYVTTSVQGTKSDVPSDGWTVTICTYQP